MDTDALRWFQQVADGVTVTEVSELEGVSQPGVSRALARLEVELGTPLLRRSGRTLRMTHAGSAFKRHVDALLHQLDDGLAAVEEIIAPETGTVALAFQMSLGTWLVPDLVSSFRLEHPQVRFALTQVRDDRVDTVLAKGRAALVLSTVRPALESVRRQRLMDEPLRLAVPSTHRLAQQQGVRLADAAEEPFLMLHRRSLLRRSSPPASGSRSSRPPARSHPAGVAARCAISRSTTPTPSARSVSPGRRRVDSCLRPNCFATTSSAAPRSTVCRR
jgi:LysR family transcriptional activator of glutamate synthase operon